MSTKQSPAAKLDLPITPERVKFFRTEIDRGNQLRENKLATWDAKGNLERYLPPEKGATGINTGVDFSDVETKKAGIFYDTPTVHVKPDPECPPQAALLQQEFLNTVLLKIDAKGTALKCLQNCLLVIQPAPAKIGYIPTIIEVDQPVMQPVPDPMNPLQVTQQPVVDAKGKPQTQKVPVVVHEEFFWTHLSPKSLIVPADFKDTAYDRASWLAYKWRKPISQVRREYDLADDYTPPLGGDAEVTLTDERQTPDTTSDPQITGAYIEYRAADLDPKVTHPLLRRCLVLIDGDDNPVKHANVGWQEFDPSSGWLTPDSLDGSTIHPLALRDLPDSAWVPADSSITGPLTRELNEYRSKIVRQRDGSVLVFTYDASRLDPEAVEKIKAGESIGHWVNGALWVPVQSGAIENGQNSAIAQVPTLEQGRESYLGQEVIEHDRDRILGINANRAGVANDTPTTATEQTLTQRNTDARFNQEAQRMMGDWWLRGAAKLSCLLVRYGDRLAMQILGPQRGAEWLQFKQAGVLGRFSYELKIDSGKYIDVEADRRQWLQLYNAVGKDPNANRVEVLKPMMQAYGLDVGKAVIEQLPEPKPEPPKINLSIKGEDFNPANPQFAIVVELMRAGGSPISEASIQLAQLQAQSLAMVGRSPKTAESANDPIEAATSTGPLPTSGVGPAPNQPPQQQMHGGGMPHGELINKHQSEETGKLPGSVM